MSRKTNPIDALGVVGTTWGGCTNFHSTLIQIAHKGQEPTCDEPAFRLLRFTENKRDAVVAKRSLEKKLKGSGNILNHKRDTGTIICTDVERQVDPAHVWPKIVSIKTAFLDHVRFTDEDFAANRR